MRSALCVTMLAVCLIALQCTGANDLSDNPDDKQITEDSSAVAEKTTTKQPQAAPNSQTVTLPEVSQSKPDSAGPDVLDAPADAALSEDPLIKTTTDALPTNQLPLQPPSADQHDLKDQQQPQLQQANTGQTSGVKQPEDHAEIQPLVGNPPNQHATQSEPDVKTPDAPPSPQTPPALSPSGQSKQQQSQQSQTPQTNTSLTGEKSQDANGDASQPGQIAPPTTTTAATKEKRNKDTKEATTTTVAPTLAQSIVPTTTAEKQSTLSQSVDKKDGSRSNLLLFAFATLVTLAVIPVAPEF